MKDKFLEYYMGIAEATAQLSSARRLKVGSVVVRDHQIIGTGYNGTPAGWDNNCEDQLPDGTLVTKNITIHSESNSLMKVARSTESSVGATMFCTYSPCIDCAKLIHQAGITKLYYRNSYKSNDGLDFLEQCGVDVISMPGPQAD
jgi:dCMP deaminase